MRKGIVYIGIVAGTIYVLAQPTVYNAIFAFLFIGALPGTKTTMPFWGVLSTIILINLILLQWIIRQPLYIGDDGHKQQRAKQAARIQIAKDISRKSKSKRSLIKSNTAKTKNTRRKYQAVAPIS